MNRKPEDYDVEIGDPPTMTNTDRAREIVHGVAYTCASGVCKSCELIADALDDAYDRGLWEGILPDIEAAHADERRKVCAEIEAAFAAVHDRACKRLHENSGWDHAEAQASYRFASAAIAIVRKVAGNTTTTGSSDTGADGGGDE